MTKHYSTRYRTEEPDYTYLLEMKHDWSYTVYCNIQEIITHDCPKPLGKSVTTTTTIDANLLHSMATGASLTACLHFCNQTPTDWYSKKQATYGSEFVAAKTATEQIMDIRYKLRYLGVPIRSKSYMFGDNRSVVTSVTLPHSTLSKTHNSLAFHRVREGITATIIDFHWIKSEYNLSDMSSKHWEHSKIFPVIQKMLITCGPITLIPKSATEETFKPPLQKDIHNIPKTTTIHYTFLIHIILIYYTCHTQTCQIHHKRGVTEVCHPRTLLEVSWQMCHAWITYGTVPRTSQTVSRLHYMQNHLL